MTALAPHSSKESALDPIQQALAVINSTPDLFRVISKFNPESFLLNADLVPKTARFFTIVDTETTGIDILKDAIVELGLVKVAYDAQSFEVFGAVQFFEAFEDPGMPISEAASKVNNITDVMVKGKAIDDKEVETFLTDSDFILCHNSSFDRPILERRFPFFQDKRFACSLREIDWFAAGIGGAKLDYIAYRLGFFFEGHRAATDCFALGFILKHDIPDLPGIPFLQLLLDASNAESRRIWAVGAPFGAKEDLRARGYRWSDGTSANAEKAWWIDVPAESLEAEMQWLKASVFANKSVALPTDIIDARSRFSLRRVRAGLQYL